MATAERWCRIVLDPELDGLGGILAGNLRDEAQAEIDARRYAPRGNDIAVFDDPRLFMGRADKRQEIGKGPMGGGAPAAQYPGDAQDESAGADRGDVLGLP